MEAPQCPVLAVPEMEEPQGRVLAVAKTEDQPLLRKEHAVSASQDPSINKMPSMVSDLTAPLSNSNGNSNDHIADQDPGEGYEEWSETAVRDMRRSSSSGFGWFSGSSLHLGELEEEGDSLPSALPTPQAQILAGSTGGFGRTISRRASLRMEGAAKIAMELQHEGEAPVSRKSFYNGAETISITLGSIRVRRDEGDGCGWPAPSAYAQYEIVVATNKELLRCWKRHASLEQLARYAAGGGMPRANIAWHRLLQIKKGHRCLDPEYLRQKRMFILAFLSALLSDLQVPSILLDFMQNEEP